MGIDLTICIPGIRPDRWQRVLDSAKLSCKKYSFEMIFVGPYDPSPDFLQNDNVKFIKDYGTSVRSTHIGVTHASGKYLARTDDDGDFLPDSLDSSIDLFRDKCRKDAVGLRYREGKGYRGGHMPDSYWRVKTHLPEMNVPDHFLVCMTLLMDTEYFKEIGGYDCRFEHLAFAAHDLCYRIQRAGGDIHISPSEVTNNDWMPGRKGDHAPIFDSHTQHDFPLLKQIQSSPEVDRRIQLNFDDWQYAPKVWRRRFPNLTI